MQRDMTVLASTGMKFSELGKIKQYTDKHERNKERISFYFMY